MVWRQTRIEMEKSSNTLLFLNEICSNGGKYYIYFLTSCFVCEINDLTEKESVGGKIFFQSGANPKALRKDAISWESSCMFVVGVAA